MYLLQKIHDAQNGHSQRPPPTPEQVATFNKYANDIKKIYVALGEGICFAFWAKRLD